MFHLNYATFDNENLKKNVAKYGWKVDIKMCDCMDDKLHPMNEKYPFALRNHANVVSWQNLYLFLVKPWPFNKTFLFVG
jgi:hypothetical protein